jgi:hypothetical protein
MNLDKRIAMLGALCFIVTVSCFVEERQGPVEEPFSRAQRELREATDEYHRWLALTDYALVAVDRVSNEEVRESANETLRLAPKYRNDWNYGNAVHKANLALGRVALREGDLVASRKFLVRAGETPGSPQLDSFGPNMILAKELFERGERQVLLEYFRLCDRFWDLDWGKLGRWSKQVNEGVEPDFGPNLVY